MIAACLCSSHCEQWASGNENYQFAFRRCTESGHASRQLKREEILELGWTKRIHKDDAARVQQSRARAIGPLQIFQIDYRIEVPVAGTRAISAFSTALMTTGKFAGRIGIVRDVTSPRGA